MIMWLTRSVLRSWVCLGCRSRMQSPAISWSFPEDLERGPPNASLVKEHQIRKMGKVLEKF